MWEMREKQGPVQCRSIPAYVCESVANLRAMLEGGNGRSKLDTDRFFDGGKPHTWLRHRRAAAEPPNLLISLLQGCPHGPVPRGLRHVKVFA